MKKTVLAAVVFVVLMYAAPFSYSQGYYKIFGSEEDLSEDDWLQIESLKASPVNINTASAAELAACGLFTAYQAASILDYRKFHGPIMSAAELGLLDGIGTYLADALVPFIRFGPAPDASGPASPKGHFQERYALKKGTYSWASKLQVRCGAIDAGAAAKSGYGSRAFEPPSSWSFYIGHETAKVKWVAGDYNLRFGQGLSLWSGLTFTGVSSPLSMYKRATGVSGTSSYSGASHRGIAAGATFGDHFVVTPFVSFPGAREWMQGSGSKVSCISGANLNYLLPCGQVGLTAFGGKGAVVSSDARFCLAGKDLFAELAFQPSVAAVAGCAGIVIPVFDRGRAGVSLRYFNDRYDGKFAGAVRSWSKTSDETGLALTFGAGDLSFALNSALRPSNNRRMVKTSAANAFNFGKSSSLKVKAQFRWENYSKPYCRSELRTDFCYDGSAFKFNSRVNIVRSEGWGFLSYMETCFLKGAWSLWTRMTVFHADRWNDRLYCYERSVPGSFSVPAYYKRGGNIAAYLRIKSFKGKLTFYATASCTGYLSHGNSSRDSLLGNFNFLADFNF